MNTRKYLEIAVDEAEKALHAGNYPFGAIVVDSSGDIISRGKNGCFSSDDISAHAEIQCLRKLDIKKYLIQKKSIICSFPVNHVEGVVFLLPKQKALNMFAGR